MTSAEINPVAASGFTSGADAYERARPGYPAAAVARIGVGAGDTVLDVAAGTGKLTRLLVGSGARVVALEPVAAMAAGLRRTAPGVPVAAGLAEAIPVADASVDVVTVAQAFHWFDTGAAFAECTRILRPGGRLVIVFNERDHDVPWVQRFTELLIEHGGERPYERDRDWAEVARAHGFVDVVAERFDNPVRTDRQGVVDRAASTSFIAALPEDRHAAALAAVADLVASMDEPFDFPHRTDLTIATRPA